MRREEGEARVAPDSWLAAAVGGGPARAPPARLPTPLHCARCVWRAYRMTQGQLTPDNEASGGVLQAARFEQECWVNRGRPAA